MFVCVLVIFSVSLHMRSGITLDWIVLEKWDETPPKGVVWVWISARSARIFWELPLDGPIWGGVPPEGPHAVPSPPNFRTNF